MRCLFVISFGIDFLFRLAVMGHRPSQHAYSEEEGEEDSLYGITVSQLREFEDYCRMAYLALFSKKDRRESQDRTAVFQEFMRRDGVLGIKSRLLAGLGKK